MSSKTYVQYLHIEASEKGAHTNKRMTFFLKQSSDEDCVFTGLYKFSVCS